MNVLLLLALVVLVLWFFTSKASGYKGGQQETVAVPETIIQDLATEVRRKDPEVFPVETIFVNQNPDGTLMARMLFINLRGFFGTQYDIFARTVNGKVEIISKNETPAPNMDSSFQPFKPDVYTPYMDVKTAVLATLKGVRQ
jgi:hypothetical protein